ncbi:serine recombinase [Alicyclobacillus acidoterrestris]|nr:serine recombinase [Alicyclobacillus acidoterrestris]
MSSVFPHDMDRVAIYLRKSREDLAAEARGEGETLGKHRRALLKMAKQYRYAISDVFEEIVSGDRIFDRPEVQQLLRGVEAGEYNAVLCMDLDRLGRGNMRDQAYIQEAFKDSKTLIITPRKVYNLQDEQDEEWSEFESFMARRELKTITRRLQQGRKQSAQDGRSISKKPPFGYLRDENNRLYPDPETSKIVQMIFEWHAEGLGITKIAHMLQDMGAPRPTKHPRWEKASVRDILDNEAYLGRIIWGRHKYFKDKSGKQRRIVLPREEWIIAKNAHEPIISQELWDKARKMGQKLAPHVTYDYSLKSPLAGLIKCPECGKTMVRRKRANRPNANLLCPTYKCNTKATTCNLVEARIIEQLKLICAELPKQDHKQKKATQPDQLKFLEKKLNALNAELKTLQTQKASHHDWLEQGVYDVDTFIERSRIVGDKIDKVNSEIRACEAEISRFQSSQQRQNELLPAIAKAVEEYEKTTDVEKQNKILKSVIREIRYHRKKDWPRDRDFELEIFLRV